jgi:hypothetical protein
MAGLGAVGLFGSGFGPFETVQAKTNPAVACQLLAPRTGRRMGPTRQVRAGVLNLVKIR